MVSKEKKSCYPFFEPGLKLDEKSIENGLEGQKCSVGCILFHFP